MATLARLGIAVVASGGDDGGGREVQYVLAGGEINQAVWVVHGRGDAGAFNEVDWESLPTRIRDQLRVFHRSPPILRGLLSFRAGYDSVLREQVEEHESERQHLIADLERKNAELEQFTYTVSHDLKSPLVTILGFAGVIAADLKAGKTAEVPEQLARITAAGEQMSRLLDDLLELSRIGRIVNPPEDVPLGEIAREAVDLVRGRADAGAAYRGSSRWQCLGGV